MGNHNGHCSDKPGKGNLGNFHKSRMIFIILPEPVQNLFASATVLMLGHKNKDFSAYLQDIIIFVKLLSQMR